jgi:Zn-dependent metalloprotease
VAFGVLLAVMISGPQGAVAFGVPSVSPRPSPSPARSLRLGAERTDAVAAGKSIGLGAGEKLVVKDVLTDPDGSTHVRYDRTFDGLRVIGGDLVTHRERSGKIRGISWNRSHEVSVASTKPRLSLASATAAGRRKASLVQEATASSKAELVVYARGTGSGKPIPKLAFDVRTVGVRADQTPSRLHTIVDAGNGTVLASFDEIETGAGHGIHVGSVSIGTTGSAPSFSMTDSPAGNYTTDLHNLGTDADIVPNNPGTTFTDADDTWGDGAVSDRASAGVDAQYGAEKTFDYFKNVQGRQGIWDTGVGARSRVHFGVNYVNAFWDGTQMTYGDGDNDTNPLTSIDVAGHEMTHGVTENSAGLAGDGESGGMNEATSDIFGTSVEFYANAPADNPDYLIGEQLDLSGDGSPLRYMDQPSKDGASPNCWSPGLANLDVHLSAGPLNHWFYLASEGSGAKVVNGVAYNSPTCNTSTVTGITHEKAARIWYRALTTYLTSGSGYAAAREGAVQSAKDLYGATSPECATVAASFSAISVPAGATTCSTVAPPPAGSNLLRNPGFEAGDTLWSSTPSVISEWASLGQPPHTGTWGAWLGGYGETHSDSISQVLTIPAGTHATLSYYLHVETSEPAGAPARDTLRFSAGTTALVTQSNLNAANGYVLRTVNLSAYAGQTISLRISGSENASLATSFLLDDLSLTATVAPGAPSGAWSSAGNTQATVSWVAPASTGGSAITGYTVRVADSAGNQVSLRAAAATARSLPVTGLSNGTAYRFQVLARNAAGSSPYSALTSPVTPKVTAAVTRLSDFNRDGITDVVARDSAGVLRLYPGDGAGGFKTRGTLGTGWSSMRGIVTPGDVTGDGNGDILAKDTAGVLWVYPGNGTGGLGLRRKVGSGWQNYAPTDAGNLNGTGRPDLLARDSAGVLWLYPFSGNAVLGPRVKVSSGWSGLTFWGPGDLSGDGRADILSRDAAGNVWLHRGTGAGKVLARTAVATGWSGYPTLVTPGNWNRAVGNDLMARDTSGRLWLYPGDNAGLLTAPRVIGTGWQGFTYIG